MEAEAAPASSYYCSICRAGIPSRCLLHLLGRLAPACCVPCAELAGTESQPVRCMFTRQRGLNDNARRGRLESCAPEQLIEPERELAIL
jgi:hypothetical protein